MKKIGKIGKKGIMGVALLTSLSLFAGVAVASTSTAKSTATVNSGTAQSNQRQLDANGCPLPPEGKGKGIRRDGDGKDIKKVDPARIEELKKKLNTGKVTKAEAAEIIELIELKRKGPKPEGTPSVNNSSSTSSTK